MNRNKRVIHIYKAKNFTKGYYDRPVSICHGVIMNCCFLDIKSLLFCVPLTGKWDRAGHRVATTNYARIIVVQF